MSNSRRPFCRKLLRQGWGGAGARSTGMASDVEQWVARHAVATIAGEPAVSMNFTGDRRLSEDRPEVLRTSCLPAWGQRKDSKLYALADECAELYGWQGSIDAGSFKGPKRNAAEDAGFVTARQVFLILQRWVSNADQRQMNHATTHFYLYNAFWRLVSNADHCQMNNATTHL